MSITRYRTVNYGEGELKNPISSSALSVTLKSGQGDNLPNEFPYILTIESFTVSNGEETIIKQENILVTDKTGDVLTVTRGFNGSTSQAFDPDDRVRLYIVSEIIEDIQQGLVSLENDKLNSNGELRSGLSSNTIIRTNGDGDEQEVSLPMNPGVFLNGNGAFTAPSPDITGQVEITNVDVMNDELLVSDNSDSGAVKKAKIANIVPAATYGQIYLGTSNILYITPLGLNYITPTLTYMESNYTMNPPLAGTSSFTDFVITHDLNKPVKKVIIQNAVDFFGVLSPGIEGYIDVATGHYKTVRGGDFFGGADVNYSYFTYSSGGAMIIGSYDGNGGNDFSGIYYQGSTDTTLTLRHTQSQDPSGGNYQFNIIVIA